MIVAFGQERRQLSSLASPARKLVRQFDEAGGTQAGGLCAQRGFSPLFMH